MKLNYIFRHLKILIPTQDIEGTGPAACFLRNVNVTQVGISYIIIHKHILHANPNFPFLAVTYI